jgi:hypothetical protein
LSSKWRDLVWVNAQMAHSKKNEAAEIPRSMERSIENLPFGLLGNEGSERPTGGLVDAPSSKAVEEAGHCERIVRFGMVDWKGGCG